ncbi:MAG: 30S ribosomal protein S6 [Pirellulaceae bacterium]|nr:30S ribosomal protein S6 [Pirellulaceae bacterium]
MATNAYEGMFIFDSGRFGRDPEAVSGEIARIVQDAGGEILVSRLWEERRLAYPIKGQKKGTYWLTYFRAAAAQLSAIRRQCELSDSILRFLLLKVDPRIVDALVEHAQGGLTRSGEGPADGEGTEKVRSRTATATATVGKDDATDDDQTDDDED